MKKRKIDRSRTSDQKALLQDIARLNKEKEEIDKKYMRVSLKLKHLKNSMKNLNHDLRSPLGGITGMIDSLLFEEKDQILMNAGDLNMIRESAQSILNLINGTLKATGSQKKSIKHLNIDKILSAVMVEINRLYLPMAQNKDISLSLRTHIKQEILLPPNFFVNLIQVIGNLVANAIKFTPAGGTVDVYSTILTEENHSVLFMTVTDTGKGMSAAQASAFNLGKPVSRSIGTNGEEGFGIGLQHVQAMVSEDAGHIAVISKKNFGTTFSIIFPLTDLNFIRENTNLPDAATGFVSVNGSQM